MPLLTNLKGCWELEAASGTRNDATANANNLTDNNTVTQSTGKVGNAAQFASVNSEYLSRASNSTLVTGDIDCAGAAWFYLTVQVVPSTAYPVIMTKGDAPDYEYQLFINSNNIGEASLYVEGSGGTSHQLDLLAYTNENVWHCIFWWHDSVNNLLGLQLDNGTPVTFSWTTGLKSTTNQFRIGADTAGAFGWDGLIDQVCFWQNYVPTSGERTQYYNSGNGLTYAQMVTLSQTYLNWEDMPHPEPVLHRVFTY